MELTYKWIALAGRQYQRYLNRRLAPYDLSGSQYLLVVNVCRQPGITQDKLPDILHINKSNVTRALAQLERSGFIRREVNMRDKRTAALFPTSKALEVFPRIREIITGWDASVTDSLTEDEKRTLQELLMRVVAAARQCPDGDEQAGTEA
ncbi:MarR family transcriptional regulator [Desulfovibrio piger]|nr:MarR family transcriptional regulator [Desulfovibrio piger]